MAENTQGVPASEHDIKHDESGRKTHVPDPGSIKQGTKPPEVRDSGDNKK